MKANTKRNAKIAAQRERGLTYPAIAAKYDLTPARIWQIVRAQRKAKRRGR